MVVYQIHSFEHHSMYCSQSDWLSKVVIRIGAGTLRLVQLHHKHAQADNNKQYTPKYFVCLLFFQVFHLSSLLLSIVKAIVLVLFILQVTGSLITHMHSYDSLAPCKGTVIWLTDLKTYSRYELPSDYHALNSTSTFLSYYEYCQVVYTSSLAMWRCNTNEMGGGAQMTL